MRLITILFTITNTDLRSAGPEAGHVVPIRIPGGRLRGLGFAELCSGLSVLRHLYGDAGTRRTPQRDDLVVAACSLVGSQGSWQQSCIVEGDAPIPITATTRRKEKENPELVTCVTVLLVERCYRNLHLVSYWMEANSVQKMRLSIRTGLPSHKSLCSQSFWFIQSFHIIREIIARLGNIVRVGSSHFAYHSMLV